MKNNNSFVSQLNLLDGKIIWDHFDIDENSPLERQVDSLTEDMLQIGFGKRFAVDVGWRPDFETGGHFIVVAIQDCDWMKPVYENKCRTLKELKEAIEEAVLVVDKMRKIKNLPYRNIFSHEE